MTKDELKLEPCPDDCDCWGPILKEYRDKADRCDLIESIRGADQIRKILPLAKMLPESPARAGFLAMFAERNARENCYLLICHIIDGDFDDVDWREVIDG